MSKMGILEKRMSLSRVAVAEPPPALWPCPQPATATHLDVLPHVYGVIIIAQEVRASLVSLALRDDSTGRLQESKHIVLNGEPGKPTSE